MQPLPDRRQSQNQKASNVHVVEFALASAVVRSRNQKQILYVTALRLSEAKTTRAKMEHRYLHRKESSLCFTACLGLNGQQQSLNSDMSTRLSTSTTTLY
ncbi:hypothetical protein PInf_023736 [Phytophthora infestans]|nr:hypothetical protein PInf_023736 [Phytophthora infestans]